MIEQYENKLNQSMQALGFIVVQCPHTYIDYPALCWDFNYIHQEYSGVVFQAHHTNLLFSGSQRTFTMSF